MDLFFSLPVVLYMFGEEKKRAIKIQPKKKQNLIAREEKDLIVREVKHKLKDCKIRV